MDAFIALFDVGFVHRTPDAMLQIVLARQTESCLIHRHEHGDFGAAGPCQCVQNLGAIASHHGVIRSVYRLNSGSFVSVETDLDRHETCLRLAAGSAPENAGGSPMLKGTTPGDMNA